MFEPKLFYSKYLRDYHKTKAIALKKMLEDIPHYSRDLLEEDAEKDMVKSFKFILQADLRQTYFHAIETFFELFFAFDEISRGAFDDENIQFYLTESNWRANYKRIEKIAEDDSALDFLDEVIEYNGYRFSKGQYIFYFGTFNREKFPQEFLDLMEESIVAAKDGIRMIARDFVDRKEYNCYKHGIRLIPALSELVMLNPDTQEKIHSWDLSNSMSFYQKAEGDIELSVVTRVYDPKRDYQMTYLCSNLISQIIYYRKVAICKDYGEETHLVCRFFGEEEVQKCYSINVSIQNLEYTVRKVAPQNHTL